MRIDLAGAGERAAVAGDLPAGRRVDLQVQVSEPGPDGDGLLDVAGCDAVVVGLERDERVAGDNPVGVVLGGERQLRQRQQWL